MIMKRAEDIKAMSNSDNSTTSSLDLNTRLYIELVRDLSEQAAKALSLGNKEEYKRKSKVLTFLLRNK